MKKQQGITMVEVMIVIFFLMIFASLASRGFGALDDGNVTFSVNGMVETKCIEGYKFIIDQQGTARQILDEFGKGARCN